MGTVRFQLRIDQPNKDGSFPIRLIYSIEGKRIYFVPNKNIFCPANWDQKNQKAIFVNKSAAKKLDLKISYDLLLSDKEVINLNDNLSAIRKDIADIEELYKLSGIPYSKEMIIDDLKKKKGVITKKEAPKNQVFDFIDKYIMDNKDSREPGSLSVYKSLKNHLQDFQTIKEKKVTFDKIDYPFFKEFENFLITPRNRFVESRKKDGKGKWKIISLNNTTIAKQLSTIKTFMNYARMHGIKVEGNYKDFKIKKEDLEVIALTNEEFELLYNLDLSNNKKLDHVRDVFCFSCVTGLRYSDLEQLKREHIKTDEIRLTVTKTKQKLSIPLNPYSHSILEKYSSMASPLPVISNQKMNDYLKELCKLAEINETIQIVRFRGAKREEISYPKYELISVHTGRKTFCTLSLEKGMSAEEVMKISGHKDYSSFKRYINITEQRSKVVMAKAWGKVPNSNSKIV